MAPSHHKRPVQRKPNFLPPMKIYWFEIRTNSGKHIKLPKRAQDWSVERGEYIEGLPCPYRALAEQWGYRAYNASDELRLQERIALETLAEAFEEAGKLSRLLLPGPHYEPIEVGFMDGDGI